MKHVTGITLDGTPDTLPLLDHWLATLCAGDETRTLRRARGPRAGAEGRSKPDDAEAQHGAGSGAEGEAIGGKAEPLGAAELHELVPPMAGAYFGEVVRLHLLGARWHLDPEDYMRWRIEFDPCFLYFHPIGMGVEAAMQARVAGVGAHFEVLPEDRSLVREALDTFGTVREEDFFRFAIRYECLEQVHGRLLAVAQAKKETHRRFGPEVYDAVAQGDLTRQQARTPHPQ